MELKCYHHLIEGVSRALSKLKLPEPAETNSRVSNMAFAFDEIFAYGGQLIVAAKKIVPKALGVGEEKIDHSAYIQGNTQIGKPDAFHLLQCDFNGW